MKTKKIEIAFLIILIVVTFGVYVNSLKNGFVYDDNITIVDNYLIKNPVNSVSGVGFKSNLNSTAAVLLGYNDA